MMGVAQFVARLAGSCRAPHSLVLLPAATMLPRRLLRELKLAGVQFTLLADPPRVMVELARQEVDAVIVCEPAQIRDLDRLIEAVTMYYPEVPCWRYSAIESRLTPWMPMERRYHAHRHEGDDTHWPAAVEYDEPGLDHASPTIAEIPEWPAPPYQPPPPGGQGESP